jgi:hypothetical protein
MRPWNLPYNEPIYLLDGNSSIFEDEILDLYMHSGTLESLPEEDVVAPHPSTFIRPQDRRLHDPDVTFEEYHYYALKTQAEECATAPAATEKASLRQLLFRGKAKRTGSEDLTPLGEPAEKRRSSVNTNLTDRAKRLEITDEEWTNASRLMRTATWGGCFYLITTDVLGPYGVGFALGTLGWGPGVVS